jgi:hypothetical protein
VKLGRSALPIAAGALAYFAVLVATVPAPWVAYLAERLSGRVLELREPAGTAWGGSGHLYLRRRSGDLLDLGALQWRASISGFLAADLALRFANTAKPTHLELAPGGATIRDLNVELPAKVLERVAPGLETFGPEGRLLIRSDSLRVSRDSVLGLAELEWRSVRLARAQGLDFGTQVARLRGGGGKLGIEFGTLGGSVRLSGGGSWSRDTGLIISGVLEHGQDRTATMAPFLRSACSEYRDGRCAFRFAY